MRRNRIIYYLLCISALVFASFYGGPVSYTILFGLILVAPVSYAYLLTVYVFFKLYQVVTGKHITAYEPVPYYFVLQNEYLLNFCHIQPKMYSTFSYIENMDEEREYELLPNENARYDTKLICRYRGEYKVGIKSITITDFLRLFRVTYHVPEPISVVVSPRIVKLAALRIENDPARNSYRENNKLQQYPDAVVRDYIPGDPVRNIHQKLSAKTGNLKTRLNYGEERQGISIFLDSNRVSEDEYIYIPVENKCLETVLALVNYFAAYSVKSTLKYFRYGSAASSGNPMADQGRLEELECRETQNMEEFRAQISTIPFRYNDERGKAFGIMASDRDFQNCMVAFLIITDVSKELNEALYELSVSGVSCVIYYVGCETDREGILSFQNQTVVTIHPEDDLTKVM